MANFKGKKVTVMGLGLHGGGVAVVNWLVKHGAKVTVTDLKTKKELQSSIDEIKAKLDLVEVAPKANPPVAKIADSNKLRIPTSSRVVDSVQSF